MTHDTYRFRRAESSADADKLHDLYLDVFQTEDVGTLAKTMFHHLPGMTRENWFIAEEKTNAEVVSAFALIPWTWEMEGIKLRVAEMGLVGTQAGHRGQGLMRALNRAFNATLAEESYDLAVIQGIPGFYHRFGFHWAVPLENHIDLSFHMIPDMDNDGTWRIRRAGMEDIPFLMEADKRYRKASFLSAFRDRAHWEYLLTHSRKTEYGSEFRIIRPRSGDNAFYCRIPNQGFGPGLIVSEISEDIGHDALLHLLAFCKKKAEGLGKPYLRLNVHNDTPAAGAAFSLGAEKGKPYAWQIKMPDRAAFLAKMAPVFEKRLKKSCFDGFSETLRLDFFGTSLDLKWQKGRLSAVTPGTGNPCPLTFCVGGDLFPALCLGHRTWRELQHTRPDIFPSQQYIRPETVQDSTGLLVDVLFPAERSWVVEQY